MRRIDHDCSLVPYEAVKTTPTGETIENIGYRGSPAGQIGHLANYRHFRDSPETNRLKIQSKPLSSSVESNSEALNTLPKLDQDIPRGTWSLVQDSSKLVVCLY